MIQCSCTFRQFQMARLIFLVLSLVVVAYGCEYSLTHFENIMLETLLSRYFISQQKNLLTNIISATENKDCGCNEAISLCGRICEPSCNNPNPPPFYCPRIVRTFSIQHKGYEPSFIQSIQVSITNGIHSFPAMYQSHWELSMQRRIFEKRRIRGVRSTGWMSR